jgi:hypothetical protein
VSVRYPFELIVDCRVKLVVQMPAMSSHCICWPLLSI